MLILGRPMFSYSSACQLPLKLEEIRMVEFVMSSNSEVVTLTVLREQLLSLYKSQSQVGAL